MLQSVYAAHDILSSSFHRRSRSPFGRASQFEHGWLPKTFNQELQGFKKGRPPLVEVPPFSSMEELMDGEISYAVAVPDTPDAALTVQVSSTLKGGRLMWARVKRLWLWTLDVHR